MCNHCWKWSLTLINRATFKKFMQGMTRFFPKDPLRFIEKNCHFFISSRRNAIFFAKFFGDFEKWFCLKFPGGGLKSSSRWKILKYHREDWRKILSFQIYSTRIIPKIFPKICSTRKRKKYQNFNSFSIKKLQKRKNLNE